MAGESVGGITPYNMTMMPFYSGYTNSVALDSLPGFSGAFPGALSMDGSLIMHPEMHYQWTEVCFPV